MTLVLTFSSLPDNCKISFFYKILYGEQLCILLKQVNSTGLPSIFPKLPKITILVSMDVTSLYTNIPQEEGITTVCEAYEEFYEENPPIPTRYLREMLSLILQENSFQFNDQIHG